MLYYLFDYLDANYDFPGAGLFQYISFRAAMSIILALLISTVFGKRIIRFLLAKQVGESVRDLGLEGQKEKAGTPTMGGLIIILSTLIPVLLFAKLDNIYVLLLIVTTLWMGAIGFLDDYIKIFKKNKEGLQGKFKVVGQVGFLQDAFSRLQQLNLHLRCRLNNLLLFDSLQFSFLKPHIY